MVSCYRCKKIGSLRCAACSRAQGAVYCSKECQSKDWPAHIIECANPSREITTADHLAYAVSKFCPPANTEARVQYGFSRAFTPDHMIQLLAMYQALIEVVGIRVQAISRWQSNGSLLTDIKSAFDEFSVHIRLNRSAEARASYTWLLKNEWILDPSIPTLDSPIDVAERVCKKFWNYSGGDPSLDLDQMHHIRMGWPRVKVECAEFCEAALQVCHHVLTDRLVCCPNIKLTFSFSNGTLLQARE